MSLSDFLGGHHLIDFHEASMRSRDVIDLLERFDLDVIYNFDRLEEGEPDTYTVITAYVLQANGAVAGEEKLAASTAVPINAVVEKRSDGGK